MTHPSHLIFTPTEASNAAQKHVDELEKHEGDGMPLYIPHMEYNQQKRAGFLPVKRGELITVMGRPGNGKTGFMFHWARARAKDLQRRASMGDETAAKSVVIYWTMEQMIEELRLFHVAAEKNISVTDMANGKLDHDQWEGVRGTLNRLQASPLWLAGKSFARRKDKIKFTEETMRGALESVEKWVGDEQKTLIDCVFVDYFQRFRAGSGDWVQYYGDLMNGMKEMAGDFTTRMIVGIQAKREVDQRDLKLPLMDDGQWTSSIEHQADGMISVVRPSHYLSDGAIWDSKGAAVVVKGHSQMLVYVAKRKLGPENFDGWVTFAPEYNRMDEAELKRFDMNKDIDDPEEAKRV